jgi:hypothetical protein
MHQKKSEKYPKIQGKLTIFFGTDIKVLQSVLNTENQKII